MGLSSSAMRYLLAIYELSDGGSAVRSVDIARALEVSPASVVHMMGNLAAEGVVQKRHYGNVSMTQEGIRRANQLYTRYTLLSSFFRECLNVSSPWAEEDAAACLCTLSEESMENIAHCVLQRRDQALTEGPKQ